MIKLELSPQMLSVISQALGNAPYMAVKPVVDEIQRQITLQEHQLQKTSASGESGN